MAVIVIVFALVVIVGYVRWSSVQSRRWGDDDVPVSARRWSSPEWDPWDYVSPEPGVIEHARPQPATYWVGEPEQLPAPPLQLGDGR